MEEYGLRGKKLILALIVAGAVAILFRNMGKQMRNQGFEEVRIDTIQNANRAVVALKNKEKREVREDIDQLIQHYLQGEKITQAESISYLEKHKILVGEIYLKYQSYHKHKNFQPYSVNRMLNFFTVKIFYQHKIYTADYYMKQQKSDILLPFSLKKIRAVLAQKK